MYDLLFASSPELAAIDLGFNSFRLEIARIAKNRYQQQLCVEQMVSLGTGLDSRGVLSREARPLLAAQITGVALGQGVFVGRIPHSNGGTAATGRSATVAGPRSGHSDDLSAGVIIERPV